MNNLMTAKTEEVWKDIKNYEGEYQISNLGRVKSLDRIIRNEGLKGGHKFYIKKEQLLNPTQHKHGYYQVGLNREHKKKMFLVHRLVAEAFCRNPNNYKEINHIDGNKTNNSAENLEWVNHSENMKHAYANELNKGNHKKIAQFTLNNKKVDEFKSVLEASKKTGFCKQALSNAARGRYKTSYGYIWRYV